MRLGVIGCGTISQIYLQNLTASPEVKVIACADVLPTRAAARATEFGVGGVCSPSELLADPEIDLVVNLTVPSAHFPITLAAPEGRQTRLDREAAGCRPRAGRGPSSRGEATRTPAWLRA